MGFSSMDDFLQEVTVNSKFSRADWNKLTHATTAQVAGEWYALFHSTGNPSAVTLDLRSPAGVESSVTVVNDSTGLYHGDVTPDAAGLWDYRWEGNGTQSVTYEGQIHVRESAFDSP